MDIKAIIGILASLFLGILGNLLYDVLRPKDLKPSNFNRVVRYIILFLIPTVFFVVLSQPPSNNFVEYNPISTISANTEVAHKINANTITPGQIATSTRSTYTPIPTRSQTPTKTVTTTPTQDLYAENYPSFYDDFQGSSIRPEWQFSSPDNWFAMNDTLTAKTDDGPMSAYVGYENWDNYSVKLKFKFDPDVVGGAQQIGIIIRHQKAIGGIYFMFSFNKLSMISGEDVSTVRWYLVKGNNQPDFDVQGLNFDSSSWHTMQVDSVGKTVTGYFDDLKISDISFSQIPENGNVGLYISKAADRDYYVDYFSVEPID